MNRLERVLKSLLTTITVLLVVFLSTSLYSQVGENDKRYVRIGSLQSHFSAYGSERAWNNTWYEGLRWPADYPYTDNAVIKRAWIAVEDYTDFEGQHWEHWGTYITKGYVTNSLFPIQLTQTAKFEHPTVLVDGNSIYGRYAADVDNYNPDQVPDRIINNVVNTSCGLTMTRRVIVFSQQYHENYFIKEFIFTNTGNIDYDEDIELSDSLKGVRVGWGTRYSVCREGSSNSDYQQSWGKHTWVTRRGENYASHSDNVMNFTEATPFENLDWIRCAFSWLGQSEKITYDMIGAPDLKHYGRLSSPQFVGSAVIHVDKSTNNQEDDANQPVALGWHAGDTYPSVGDLKPSDMVNMGILYDFLSGIPYPNETKGGSTRMDEENMVSITDPVDPYKVHGDGGGTNVWITYGPFDLAHGDSVKIVEVEGISGLNRTMCEEIGKRWKKAYDDPTDTGPFSLPGEGTTDNKNIYKNSWIYTGMDSILLTFSRAIRNYNMGYNIPQPPLPPPLFEVNSGGDRIMLSWLSSPSESDADFAGYRIYRAIGKTDTSYQMIAEVGPGSASFDDITAVRGFSYYYYISAFNNGSNNTAGITNPIGSLESSRFYTMTKEPAFLKRQAGANLDEIRIVPNPYHIKAYNQQFIGEPDKIMFYNIPPICTIRIFTERGDLINTIEHTDGSGDESWNSITSYRQVIVSGLYIVHFETPSGKSTFRKLLVIR